MTGEISFQRAQNKFLSKVYGWMTVALVVSGAVAFFASHNLAIMKLIYGTGFGCFALAIAEVALVVWLSASIRKLSVAAATVGFLAYAVLNGATLSSIFLIYRIDSIFQIFTVSAIMFLAMAIYGSTTKTNLMSFGRYFMMAMIGIVIASLLNIFFHSSMIDTGISIVGVVIFTGLSAYDAQKLSNAARVSSGVNDSVLSKASIIGALELYLDFVNIFIYLLRLFGRRQD